MPAWASERVTPRRRSPIRILRVIPRYAPAWKYGGSVRFGYDLDTALVERGFGVTVYTSDQIDEHRRSPHRHEHLNGIEIRRFPTPWNYLASQAAWVGMYPLGLGRALSADIGRFDLVHVTEARGPHARWAFAAARANGVPVAWSPLGSLAEGVGIRKPYRRLYDVVHDTPRLVGEADVLIAQSAHEAGVFERLGAPSSRIRIIGLGVDDRWFRQLPARGQFRQALGIDPGDPIVLFIGRLHPTKGLDVLLKACAIVKRAHPQLRIAIIGWDHGALGTVRRVSRSLGLDEAVHLLPPAFEGARIQAYVDADVFAVAATTDEETSLAAMEAVASGTPCVLTRQCEIPGLESAGGGLVTECEPEAFAAGLFEVLADGNRVARARAARRTILATQTAEHRADVYAELFREIVAARGPMPCRQARAAR
jgi:glycosyltransferase involved in cell wall biosynthesis